MRTPKLFPVPARAFLRGIPRRVASARPLPAIAATLLLAAGGCAKPTAPGPNAPSILMVDVAKEWGVRESDDSDMRSGRALSSVPSGAAFGDFDGDGRLDLAANLGPRSAYNATERDNFRLYRNTGEGRFDDVSIELGVVQRMYGSGANFVDYDNDGDLDLFTTNYPSCRLYRNEGGGKYVDATAEAGLEVFSWASSAAWFDYDLDGDLDVYVLNYLMTSLTEEKKRSDELAPHTPNDYLPWPNRLHRNNGDGTFTDVTAECQCEDPAPGGKSLAVGVADFDQDGWPDIYVANDTVMNSLYHNNGDGSFTNISIEAGVAFNGDGLPEGSMGVAIGDPNNDGLLDIFITNFVAETNTFYLNLGDNVFVDYTEEANLAKSSLPYVGWGTAFSDLDLDGDEDLIVANGQLVYDLILFFMRFYAAEEKPAFAPYLSGSFNQPVLIYENLGDAEFRLVDESVGAPPLPLVAGRGLALGDIDNDGDMDAYIRGKDDFSLLLENRSRREGHPLKVYLRGVKSNRQGVGSLVRLETTAGEQIRTVNLGGSFQSTHEVVAHFGIPEGAEVLKLTVVWPSGEEQVVSNARPGGYYLVTEGTLTAQLLGGTETAAGALDDVKLVEGAPEAAPVRLVSHPKEPDAASTRTK